MPVLCQGEDAMPTLVREFPATPETLPVRDAVAVAGRRRAGHACQLVVIDRLPFPRPDEPLAAARQRRRRRRPAGTGSWRWRRTHAALRLAQGVGRLIRSGDRPRRGRGAGLAAGDARGTAAFLRASLPPFWATTDREVVLEALRRIAAQAPPPLAVAEPAARAV